MSGISELEAIKWLQKQKGMTMYVGCTTVRLSTIVEGKLLVEEGSGTQPMIEAVKNMQSALADTQQGEQDSSLSLVKTQGASGTESNDPCQN